MEIEKRVVHCKRERFDIYIGRPNRGMPGSKWANPFHIGRDGDRAEVITKYARWIVTQKHLMDSLHELRGKILGCWCDPQACHGHFLMYLAGGFDIDTALRLVLERIPPPAKPAQAVLF